MSYPYTSCLLFLFLYQHNTDIRTRVSVAGQFEHRFAGVEREGEDRVVVAASDDESRREFLVSGEDAHTGHKVTVAAHRVCFRETDIAPAKDTFFMC